MGFIHRNNANGAQLLGPTIVSHGLQFLRSPIPHSSPPFVLSSRGSHFCFSTTMASFSFGSLLILSAIFRFVLILYGEWQDANMEVRYTDVDYIVFSDAASLMASGKSPYLRSTYRYSPLLAFLLIPNSIFHRCWGKFLFSASGTFTFSFESLNYKFLLVSESIVWIFLDLLVGFYIRTILKKRGVPENLCIGSVMVWLFNPFTFTIGTRGNCEPLVCAMVLKILLCLMNGVSFFSLSIYNRTLSIR